jgi:hypothetical protein
VRLCARAIGVESNNTRTATALFLIMHG